MTVAFIAGIEGEHTFHTHLIEIGFVTLSGHMQRPILSSLAHEITFGQVMTFTDSADVNIRKHMIDYIDIGQYASFELSEYSCDGLSRHGEEQIAFLGILRPDCKLFSSSLSFGFLKSSQ